jgi:hypothetical protein
VTVSAALKARIVQQYLESYTTKENHASVRRFIKSKTTITNQVDEFLTYEEEMEAEHGPALGLQIAARKWNVTSARANH